MISCQSLYYSPEKSNFKVTLANLKFENKGITAFIGENGAGKSTIFKLISGLIRPDSGYVAYKGEDTFMGYEKIKDDVHIISNSMNLYGHISVADHIQLVKGLSTKWNEKIENRLKEFFDLCSGVKVEQLSNGQLTKLKILLSLSRMPKVLLIDEITNDLDLITREFIYQALDEYTYEHDAYVFLATNIIEDMERYASNIVVVKGGNIVECNTIDALKEYYSLNLEGIYKKLNSKGLNS